MALQTNQDTGQLLATTLQRLQQGAEHISPVDELISEWSNALGEGNQTLENVADELFSLKRALTEGKAPKIAGSLHTLSKLTKRAANESSDIGLVGQLLQLAEVLDDLSARVAQSR
jgi:ABC-type transporter Mla subunit MlaD